MWIFVLGFVFGLLALFCAWGSGHDTAKRAGGGGAAVFAIVLFIVSTLFMAAGVDETARAATPYTTPTEVRCTLVEKDVLEGGKLSKAPVLDCRAR